MIGRDRTGSGKTLAFTLPILQKFLSKGLFDHSNHHIKFLIILPTRQLTIQVTQQINSLRHNSQFNTISIYGGVDINRQIQILKGKVDIIVATPGRLLDLLNRSVIKFHQLKVVCLDEADQMLKLGFEEDIEQIFEFIQNHNHIKPQLLLFSATMPSWVQNLSSKYQNHNKIFIDLVKNSNVNNATSTTVKHFKVQYSDPWERQTILNKLIEKYSIDEHGKKGINRILIFTERKRDADQIKRSFKLCIRAQILHGDVPQYRRQEIFNNFKNGNLKCIVATNVAARGLDFPEISLVVQLQPPKDTETYIHRSGRTGRAGKSGTCVTLLTSYQYYLIRKIQKEANIKIQLINDLAIHEEKKKHIPKQIKSHQQFSSKYRIHLDNIPNTVTAKQLEELFDLYEANVQVKVTKYEQKCTGIGLCEDEESLWKALKLDGYQYGPKAIQIQWWIQN